MGSERMRHSQIDQRCGIAAPNTVNGGSCSGGEAANNCTEISGRQYNLSSWPEAYWLTLPQVGCG